MSHQTPIPAKPAEITLDTLPQLFAHNRARFGGWTMSVTPPENEPPAAPERPEGVSEEEWNALGDPGRAAILREREARQAAERALAASRARPAPPKAKEQPPAAPGAPAKAAEEPPSTTPDLATVVQQAVAAAIKPFQDAEEQRQVDAAAGRVRDAVLDAAKPRLHDATDALAGIDLAAVVNEHGQADPAKVTAALDDLVKRKPHLAKSTERVAPLGIGGGAPAGVTDADKVKSVLADMQRATGVKLPSTSTTL